MFHVAAVIERSNKMCKPGFCPSRNSVSLARVMISSRGTWKHDALLENEKIYSAEIIYTNTRDPTAATARNMRVSYCLELKLHSI